LQKKKKKSCPLFSTIGGEKITSSLEIAVRGGGEEGGGGRIWGEKGFIIMPLLFGGGGPRAKAWRKGGGQGVAKGVFDGKVRAQPDSLTGVRGESWSIASSGGERSLEPERGPLL